MNPVLTLAHRPDQLRVLDGVCDVFDALWLKHERPTIEQFLPQVDESIRLLLEEELIRIELEWRFRNGETPSPQEYVNRFPEVEAFLPAWFADAVVATESLQRTTFVPQGTSVGDTITYSNKKFDVAVSDMQILGEYELLDKLGTGGMGIVYRARHRRLDKQVALKVIRNPTAQTLADVKRFLREMRVIGQLDHPNLVEALDAGEINGTVYLAMKLIDGQTLHKWVQQQSPISIADTIQVAKEIAAGLDYLHQRQLVHRDLKPANVMRTKEGVCKILDLGLSRWKTDLDNKDEATQAGSFMGTPDYTAPEQTYDVSGVDIRADLYALGCTLWYVLIGKAPFVHHGDTISKLNAHRSESPANLQDLRPDIPEPLVRIIHKLMAKEPVDRFQTPTEVLEAIQQISSNNPDTIVDIPVPRPAVDTNKKKARWLWWPAMAGLFLIVCLLLYSYDRTSNSTHTTRTNEFSKEPTTPDVLDVQLAIQELNVRHLMGNHDNQNVKDGIIGKKSFNTYLNDSVTIEAKLSKPAYAFLIAFAPDGQQQLCFPEDETQPPELTDRPRYPSKDQSVVYGLTDGTGMQVFALVVSSKPLPSYQEWKNQVGSAPWEHCDSPMGVVWKDNGKEIEAVTFETVKNNNRGKGREIRGRTPMARLMEWLRKSSGAELVEGIGFQVQE